MKSVFDQVINLEALHGNTCGEIVAVQRECVQFTPLSVVVADDVFSKFSNAHMGDVFDIHVDAKSLKSCNLLPGATKSDEWIALLRKTMRMYAPDESFVWVVTNNSPQLSALQIEAQSALKQAKGHFVDKDFYACAESLTHLYGLGVGLTPSGDDFILGLLAASAWESTTSLQLLKQGLTEHFLNEADKLSWLSRAFLTHAFNNNFAQGIHDVLSAQTKDELVSAIAREASFGHTSGTDVLAGIYWALVMSKIDT